MKKTFIPAALLCLALCAALLIGCTPASQPQAHTISFYAEGERVAVLETAGNETLALPEAPQKSGSVFFGLVPRRRRGCAAAFVRYVRV